MTTFHLYASHNDVDIGEMLGKPEYSYRFVLSYFERALRDLGDVHIVRSLANDVPPIDSVNDMLLVFAPPHKVPEHIVDVSIPVFAWEYDTIPNEAWFGQDRQDWYSVLRRARGALTHCGLTVRTVRSVLGDSYPIRSIHSPLWERYSDLAKVERLGTWDLSGRGIVLDSRDSSTRGVLAEFNRLRDTETPLDEIPALRQSDFDIELSGVVYTAVLNPSDGRKMWVEMLSAFIDAHREKSNATLVMKLIHHDVARGAPVVMDVADGLGDFKCRVVVIQGMLDEASYGRLVSCSTYCVNASKGEGQCLPLLEGMSAGVPAVAPDHTAMADYVTPLNSFVVESTRSWVSWSHDPRDRLTCFCYPVIWESLRDKFRESFEVAVTHPERYDEMGRNAQEVLRGICSVRVVRDSLVEFFEMVRARQRG